ncbi:MAG: PAS domain S-box protein, partial [Ignavibacteriae bacterium]
LMVHQLKKGHYSVQFHRVQTAGGLKAALKNQFWDVVISEYSIPRLKAPAVFAHLQKAKLDIPLIVVSRSINDDIALSLLKAGIHDYLLKDKLAHVVPVVKRAIAATQIRRKHKTAEEENTLLAQTIKSTRDGISITDLENNIVFVNDAFVEMYGYAEYDLIGKHISLIRSPKVTAHESEIVNSDTLSNGWHGEILNRRKDGTEFTAELWTSAVKNHSGKPIALVGVARDITERRRAEEMLAKSEQKFKQLFDEAPLGYHEIDIEGTIKNINRMELEMLGYSLEEMVGSPVWKFNNNPESSRERVLAKLNGTMDCDKQVERLYKRKDGTTFPGINSESLLKDSNGTIIGIRTIVQDNTERKYIETQLQETNKNFVRAQRIAHIGHWELSIPAGERRWSEEMYRIMGCPFHEPITLDDIVKIFPPEEYERFNTALASTISGNHPYHIDFRIVRADGEIRHIHDEGEAVRDAAGNPIGMIGTTHDITEQKRSEEALRESVKLFQGLFDASPEAIILLDPHDPLDIWPIVDCNEAACKMNGYKREELVGRSIDILNTTAGIREERIAYLEEIRRKGIIHLETTHRHKNGHLFPVEVSTCLVTLGGREMVLGIDRDITERNLAEKALRESQALYRSFVEHLPAGVFRKNSEGQYVFVNSRFCELKGLNAEEILGKTPRELADYESAVEHARTPEKRGLQRTLAVEGTDHHAMIMRTGETIDIDESYPLADGTILYFHVVKSPVFADDGKIIGTQGVQFDISVRRRMEESLHESEKLFRKLFNASPDAIVLMDPHDPNISWPIIDCNEAACAMNGYTREELIGRTIDILNPIDGSREERLAYIASLRHKGTIHDEISHRHKDGHIFPIEVSTTLVTLGGREIIMGIDRDITERKKVEFELKESEERYRRLVEFSPDAIIVHSEGKIVYVNPASITLLGAASAADLIGRPFMDIIHPDHRDSIHQEIIAVMKEEYAIPPAEQKFLRLDGSIVEVEVAALPIIFREKSAMQMVARDISEQKKLQIQLIQTQKIQSIGTLAGGIAHDFNNILGIILAYSTLLDKNKLNAEKFAVSITAINQAVQRGAALVRQILTFARKTDIVFEPMDISDMIREVFSMLEQTFPRTIIFSECIAQDLPFIFADRTQVHQAILNLCINARDAMPDGGSIRMSAEQYPVDQIRQQFPDAQEDAYVCLSVCDTGTGMDETTRQRVFDPFFTTKDKGKGTGLGLSVVYGVVQAHHGFIDLKSEVGKGTTFRLFFPVPQKNNQAVDTQQAVEIFETGGTETILFVEDEDMLVQMVTVLLESKGYTVMVARDGLEAVNVYLAHQHEISLVLTDMGLPVLTGTDEFKKLKEINPNIKVIFASGYIEPDTKSELFKDGARGFIQKPYEPNDILRIIRHTLDDNT